MLTCFQSRVDIERLVEGGHLPVELGDINTMGHVGDHGFIGCVVDKRCEDLIDSTIGVFTRRSGGGGIAV